MKKKTKHYLLSRSSRRLGEFKTICVGLFSRERTARNSQIFLHWIFFFFKLFILYWSIADYTVVVQKVKSLTYNERDPGSIPGLGRSPRGGNGNSLQCFCLENPWTEEPGRLQSMGSQRVSQD